MRKWTDIIYFDDNLWAEQGLLGRSAELTPLYIERYRGPRMNPDMTSHQFWELSCVITGNGTLKTSQTELLLEADTIYLVPPNFNHYELTTQTLETIWIGLRGSRLPVAGDEVKVINNSKLSREIIKLWRIGQHRHNCLGCELDGLLSVIMSRFFRLLTQNSHHESHSIQTAISYLQDNFTEQISFADIARKAGYSEGHFYRLFKQLTNESPSHFLTSIRIRHACNLLTHTNFSLAEIAKSSGFNDQFYFSRVFKKWLGSSPSQFRN